MTKIEWIISDIIEGEKDTLKWICLTHLYYKKKPSVLSVMSSRQYFALYNIQLYWIYMHAAIQKSVRSPNPMPISTWSGLSCTWIIHI